MKIIIKEESLRNIIKRLISEETDGEYMFYDMLSDTIRFVFSSIKNKEKIRFRLIDPNQYKKALDEFVKYGELVRFPEKIVQKWKHIVLYNIALLSALTDVNGHSPHFPLDEFNDEFYEGARNYEEAVEILDQYNADMYLPKFSNGHYVLSDYGLNPLFNLAQELVNQEKPEEIIVTINKILDVAHYRSDLSELFLKGGQKSHYSISNS